jgi:hypothetical protein
VIGGVLGCHPAPDGAPNHVINQGAIQAPLLRASPIGRDLQKEELDDVSRADTRIRERAVAAGARHLQGAG